MKKIKLFLASSINDLRIDRLEVGDFIRQLNEIYFDRGVQFFLCKCEDYDNAIAADGKQSEYDREIRDSELCFFLFFKKVGDYTRHEFEVALDAFKTYKKPKIVTYFKYVETPDEAQGEVKAFMQMLDGEIRHYYNIYQNIDTLKLGVLMQIKLMGLDAEEPKVENGKVTFGGQTVADTAALPVFAGNASLSELKEKHRSLTEKYYELREKLSSDLDDEEAEEEYRTVASERAETEKKLREAEKGVLEAMKSMAEQTAKGALSARQVAAYRAFEQGNYQGALEILDFHEIMADLSHNEQMAEGYKAHIQTNVNELLQRIQVLKADGVDKATAAEIKRIYETVAQSIGKYGLRKEPLFDYSVFLIEQGEYARAVEIAGQIEYYFSDPENGVSDENRAKLCNLFGILYKDMARYEDAEAAFLKAKEIYEKLVRENPSGFETKGTRTYLGLGAVYQNTMRYAEAEKAYKKVVEIADKLARDDPRAADAGLAEVFNRLGRLYSDTVRYQEAEAAYKKAITIGERLAKQ